jgi:AraC-like DNA-binding protein
MSRTLQAAERPVVGVSRSPHPLLRGLVTDYHGYHHVGDAPGPELQRAWHLVVGSGGTARVADVARETGWSRRHLTSSFTDEFGLSPKQLARVVRLQQARSLVLAGRPLGEVAVSAGYADQAHLTREWRALAGCTPGEWVRDEVPIVQDTRTAARAP